jgi:hypothetical protein
MLGTHFLTLKIQSMCIHELDTNSSLHYSKPFDEKNINECGVGTRTLKEAFLDLFGIACTKDASVAAHLERFGGFNKWNVSFVRAAHD